ncbi:sensor histidine kinase KdpD [Flavobacterium sp. NKUCC04_CG]|uniref:sensor histidine kinase n=1 Tax=Flavobacterium sp. NKUCC04_CG TaxID=2842121 RepID=UPI001C5BBDAE|nr:HAMP domain-containing sensor histidine kinase [Flavobacterium sp. NKUCC04_CG]MBW3519567.1 HAMP domain-containing histidine kinase [Flavobacterium sp. NKUCC04_CG]
MKNKNFLYIGASTLLFLLLLAIHAYYFYNSYQLKQKEILNSVHSKLFDLEEQIPYFEESDIAEDEILVLFSKYQRKEIAYQELVQYFNNRNLKISPRITAYIDSLFKKQNYQVAIKKELVNLIALPTDDTLIKTPFVMYQTATPITVPRTVTDGKWVTSSFNSDRDTIDLGKQSKNEKPNFHFQINRKTTYDVANLTTVVLWELIPLMLSSILILASVLILYYLTYKNLIKHRQESIILHDIVDNISHEFKTPIATLKIASKTLSKENSLAILPLIDRQINRLENLLIPIQYDYEQPYDFERVQEKDIADLWNDFAFSNPTIQFQLQFHITKIPTLHRTELQTLISNLVGNSIKYGANQINLQIDSDPIGLQISISDNGIGMEHQELKHILKKFYRIQKNNIQNTKGLGLGLYLVHKIILKHKGSITFKSKINQGTTVKISIPYEN